MINIINDYKQADIPKEEEKPIEEIIKPRISSNDIGKIFSCFDIGIEFEDADIVFNLKMSNDSPCKITSEGMKNIKLRVAKRELKKMFEYMYINS